MNEELKKEARERYYVECRRNSDFSAIEFIERYIDRATLAERKRAEEELAQAIEMSKQSWIAQGRDEERKRCAEIARGIEEREDMPEEANVAGEIATAIEKGEI